VQLATGGFHTCALVVGGAVQCWGNNNEGALGTGDWTDAAAPVPVRGIRDVIAITAGGYHTCALRANYDIMCWGLNADGQLGDGTTSNSPTPQFAKMTGAAISAGGFHTCAILTNANLTCWGRNTDGQLGAGMQLSQPKNAVKKDDGTVLTATSVVGAIGAGQLGGALLGGYHTCAIGRDAELYCWGNNNERQTDVFGFGIADLSFAHLAGRKRGGFLMVAAGAYHTCALRMDGIYCQGHNVDGELGNGTFSSPDMNDLPLIGTAGAYHLAVGGFHSCAVLSSTSAGTVACWGNNGDGQVTGFPGSNISSPTNVVQPIAP
jgi:alpha-tubulin suppressor-like RCC1 family protein